MTDTIVFSYKPKPWVMLLIFVFFAVCTAVFTVLAIENDRTLVILYDLIFMEPQDATIFYGVFALGSAALTLFCALALWRGLRSTQTATIRPDAVVCPKSGMSNRIVTIPFASITRLERAAVQMQEFLNIHHTGGELSVAASMFASKDQFEEFTRIVAERTDTAGSRPVR
ncbi:MAG: hypothetical protein CSA74_00955 [Rhodobacterales bacterium]|nr:MAG: hypothetical protein CSA74_00955 [Rhodobacterales bacterium]